MLRKNFLKEKLDAGEPVIGTWHIIPSPVTTDILASSGMDFLIIDAEHGPTSYETAQVQAAVCESRQVSPVMRVAKVSEDLILRALDIGMHCIQVPNVHTMEQAKKVVEYAKYPPQGKRGFSPFTRAGNYNINNAQKLPEQANKNVLVAIHVEGVEAIENIETIASIPGIDIIFIGLYDITSVLGIPGKTDDPKVMQYLESLTKTIESKKKVAGTIVTNKKDISSFLDIGLRYLLYSVDCDIIREAFAEPVSVFKQAK